MQRSSRSGDTGSAAPRGGRHCAYLFHFSFVFPSCGDAPANMPFRLVDLQNLLYLQVQRPVYGIQTFGEIFMYGGLADSKMPGGRPDGGFVFYYVFRKLHGAPFDVGFQMHHSKPIYC